METGPPSRADQHYPGDQVASHPDDAGYNLNLLPAQECRQWAQILRTGSYFNQIVIETGGGYVDPHTGRPVRWPAVTTHLSKYSAPGGTAQVNIPARQLASINAARAARDQAPITSSGNKQAVHLILWRADTQRPLPKNWVVSHCAEAYHRDTVIPGWVSGWKVEIHNCEDDATNESRKRCAADALMWRKACNGELILPADKDSYTGPTMCPHASLGRPCYAPYPLAQRAPTGTTPGVKGGKKRSRT